MLDHLGALRCDLVGHSMGGSIAITLAAARPDLVGRLVVAEGNLDPGGGMVSRPIAAQSETAFVQRGYDRSLAVLDQRSDAASYAATVRAADRVGLYRSAVGLLRGTTPTMRERLLAADVPRTFIFGELSLPDEDEHLLPEHGVYIEVVPAAGHDMMHDNPTGFAKAVAAGISRDYSRAAAARGPT
ncbi:MAG: alpha/beta hydrolase [Candidatus Bipolaricaulota bacterium]|nr:MAG: alpha/beta hydrolase [Candidatus Bipolaricaulota bacterium]